MGRIPIDAAACVIHSEATMEDDAVPTLFMHVLGVPEQVAQALFACGHTSIEEVAYVPAEELLATPGVPQWLLLEVRERARLHLFKDFQPPSSGPA